MANFEQVPYEPRTVSDHLHVRVLAVDRVRLDSRWLATGVRDSFWRLYLNSRPGAVVTSAGRVYPIRPARVMVIPAWVTYDCRASGLPGHLFIHFDPVGWPGVAVRRVFDRPFEVPASPAIRGVSEMLTASIKRLREPAAVDDAKWANRQAAVRSRGGEQGLLSLAKAMVFLTLAAELGVRDGSGGLDRLMSLSSSPIWPAVRLAEEAPPGPAMRTSMMARACGMSRSHFARRFRDAVGQPPAKYVMERRIARCAERLALSDESIKQVASTGGFGNRLHFARAFKRVMGVAPAKYRDAAR